MIAYHFVGETLRDGRPVPADGEWLEHQGECAICEMGLHASEHPFDALQYAPGAVLCMVECEDVQDQQENKFVCRRRKIIARFDATEMISTWSEARVAARKAAWKQRVLTAATREATSWETWRDDFKRRVDAEFAKLTEVA